MRDDALHLYTWGRNRHGVLGHGDDPSSSDVVERPRRVLAAPPLLQIAAGEASVALTQAGGVVAWGSGLMGALGRGSRASSAAPAEVLPPSAAAVAVAAGAKHRSR